MQAFVPDIHKSLPPVVERIFELQFFFHLCRTSFTLQCVSLDKRISNSPWVEVVDYRLPTGSGLFIDPISTEIPTLFC